MYIFESTPASYFNTLFCGNSAVVYGGGIREATNTHSSVVHLKYLFFTKNSAADTYGNDFSVHPSISDSPLLYSFSTSTSNRVSIAVGTTSSYSQKNSWLPQANSNTQLMRVRNLCKYTELTHKEIVTAIIRKTTPKTI